MPKLYNMEIVYVFLSDTIDEWTKGKFLLFENLSIFDIELMCSAAPSIYRWYLLPFVSTPELLI